MKKSNKQAINDYSVIENAVKEKHPNLEWEDVAMWMQTPKKFLFDRTPIDVCATEDISHLLKFIKEKDVLNEN